MEAALREAAEEAGFQDLVVCTEEGLLVAGLDASGRAEELAGLTALFDEVVLRAERDLGLVAVGELTLLSGEEGRLVVRPVPSPGPLRLFVAGRLPARNTWRRATNALLRRLAPVLAQVVGP
jgi:hypothetical protein